MLSSTKLPQKDYRPTIVEESAKSVQNNSTPNKIYENTRNNSELFHSRYFFFKNYLSL